MSCITTLPANSASGTLTGTVSVSGLKNGGKITEVTLVDYEWRALPATPLVDRNSVAIQNYESGVDVKINYLVSEVLYKGAVLKADLERFYNITDAIIIYGKAKTGTVVVTVEEIS